MNASKTAMVMYRVSAVLLLLFAAAHQVGFRQADPAWNADAAVQGMQSTHFAVNGFQRSYWSFFSGFGFFVTVLLLFSAVLCWSFANRVGLLRNMIVVPWALAISYTVIAIMTWQYFFVAPGVFSTVVALCLVIAATGATSTNTETPAGIGEIAAQQFSPHQST